MIKSIELKNIQSHEDTRLDFDKGINCIVGSSNNGKSAILRGLYWLRYNRPLGIDTLASHWALNKKGELDSEMSVQIENDFGTVCRKRTKNENQYIVDDEVLNVVKSDVPAGVESILKLSDTNIQRQLDAPFLLSQTSGEVAKYFNHVVRLDVIDKVLTNAESQRRKTKSDIEVTEKIINEQESKKEKYAWLDSVEKLLRKWNNVKSANDELRSQVDKLNMSLIAFETNNNNVSKYNAVVCLKDKLEKITTLSNKVSEIDDLRGNLAKSLDEYNLLSEKIQTLKRVAGLKKIPADIEKLLNNIKQLQTNFEGLSEVVNKFEELQTTKQYDFTKQKKMVEKLMNHLNSDFDVKKNKIENLEESIFEWKKHNASIDWAQGQIKTLKKQLPEVCPLCGSPMKNGVCENA